MHIERFDPAADGRRLAACYQMFAASSPIDDPNAPVMSSPAFGGWWERGFGGNPQQTWLATGQDGEPAGCYLLELPERDNLSIGICFPLVSLQCRRRGIGTALLAHGAGQAALAGRTMLVWETRDQAAGTGFARTVGAQQGETDLRRVLTVEAGLPGRLAELRALAEPRASGYSLQSWAGPAAQQDVDQVAAVFTAMADAPRPASMEADVWDAARVRADEARVRAAGQASYSVAARCDATSELAALTQVCVDPLQPDWAFQMQTAVARPHRGHKLGLLVKVAMQQLLAHEQPAVRRVMTENGRSNQHMIAINEQLGYQVTDTLLGWELPVADAIAACSSRAQS